jgi:hypothetical protein
LKSPRAADWQTKTAHEQRLFDREGLFPSAQAGAEQEHPEMAKALITSSISPRIFAMAILFIPIVLTFSFHLFDEEVDNGCAGCPSCDCQVSVHP